MFLGLRTAAYQVKDLDKAKAWYSNVLGIQPYFDRPFYPWGRKTWPLRARIPMADRTRGHAARSDP